MRAVSLERGAGAGAVAARGAGREAAGRGLRVLWLPYLDYGSGSAHGGNLRLFNYARELTAAGHEIRLAVRRREGEDAAARTRCLEGLKQEGVVADYFLLDYRRPRLRGKLGRLLFHPALANLLLRRAQAEAAAAVRRYVEEEGIDLCIFSARDLLFMLPEVGRVAPTLVDWVDSYFLYHLREARLFRRERRPVRALASLRLMAEAFIEERYYGGQSTFNLAVSPVDKRYLDMAGGAPAKNRVLLNGVEARAAGAAEKVKGRIIFSGIMDFPPNYKSALWFIDEVMPLLAGRPDLKLVVAGANPVEGLRARASERVEVTGYVEDLRREIARSELYVAPLVCGGGFKNKVVEALSSGTFVAATSMAVEFLGEGARRHLLVADTPAELAAAILAYLDDPSKYAADMEAVVRVVNEELTWRAAAGRLADIAREATAGAVKNDG